MGHATAQLHTKTTSSGKEQYYAVWYDPDEHPKRIWRTLRTTNAKVARRRLVDLEREYHDGTYNPWKDRRRDPASGRGDALPLEKAVQLYLADRKRHDSPFTQRTKKGVYNRFLRAVGPTTLVKHVTPDHIQLYLDELTLKDGKTPLAPKTKHNHWAFLYGFFSWCERRGYIRRHPQHDLDTPDDPEGTFHVLTPAEVLSITSIVEADMETDYRMEGRGHVWRAFELAAVTGLRLGEICALTWGGVTFTHLKGETPSAIIQVHSDARGRGFRTKTRKGRRFPVFPRAAMLLHELHFIAEARLGHTPRPGDPVLVGPRGAALGRDRLTHLFGDYASRAGVHARFHDLRHTFISWSVNELGLPISVVQEMAGHSNPQRTILYQRVSESTVNDAVTRALRLAGLVAEDPQPSDLSYQVARFVAGLNGSGEPASGPPSGSTYVLHGRSQSVRLWPNLAPDKAPKSAPGPISGLTRPSNN